MANKYLNHQQNQLTHILDHTQRLCIEKGIDCVSIADIAKSCHITRATIYNYFHSKEDILWAIFYRHQTDIYQQSYDAMSKVHTTYEKMEAFAYTTLELYQHNEFYPLFMDIFGSIYINASAQEDFISDNPFNIENIQPGDLVKTLSSNFHDGSVKEHLDPKLTTVTFVYAITSMIHFIYKNKTAMPVKYQISSEDVATQYIQWLLETIKV